MNPKSRAAYFAKMKNTMKSPAILPSATPKIAKPLKQLDLPPGNIQNPIEQKNKFMKLKGLIKPIKPLKIKV